MKYDLTAQDPSPSPNPEATILLFQTVSITGETLPLSAYAGQVLLIVNVASQCGYTQVSYSELQQLNLEYYAQGLRILAFPCNQFGGQVGAKKKASDQSNQLFVSF